MGQSKMCELPLGMQPEQGAEFHFQLFVGRGNGVCGIRDSYQFKVEAL
jgi:hypothetical protein